MTQTVLPQLQEIASDLESQEEAVAAQLEEIREKLNGVRAVLPLFEEGSYDASAVAAVSQKLAASDAENEAEAPAEVKKETKRTPRATSTKQKKGGKKKDGRTASWQKYTRPGVKEKTIPEAVRFVLSTQPDKSFKIAEVMDALFKDMPKSQYLKARNRISNVLSGGVRDGEWYKGDRGTYRLMAE
ncbi:MAG: hypothetical protein AAFQ40_12770 [Cyanobacteria bacterium J06623_5]